MKNLYLLLIFTLLFPVCLFSQGENDNWYFGDKAGLNFSTNPPTVLLDSQMTNTVEAVGVASDSNGGLLFYNNGDTIWNRDHGIMFNGTGLSGGESTQQTYIVRHPHPNNSHIFYVFTMALRGANTSFIAYSIVDMNLGGMGIDFSPLGGVSNKNIPILDENGNSLTYITEAVTGTMHGDNFSYWILIPNGSKLYSYRVDGNGFNNTPETSNLTFPSLFDGWGEIKVSPNLPNSLGLPYTNLVSISKWGNPNYNDLIVQSFDNTTGLLTNDYYLHISYFNAYSTEFTSDGLLLYTANRLSGTINVFDLFGNPNDPNEVFNSKLTPGSLQRNKNGDIYLSYSQPFPGSEYISKIINPNSFSTASVDLHNIYLSGRNCRSGLPQLIPQPLPPSWCPVDWVLSSPETNNIFSYWASNTITTNQNYIVDVNKNIIFNAGKSIEMQPNTFLKAGSVVLAYISGCVRSKNEKSLTFETTKIYIDLDGNEKEELKVYPNPVKDRLNIQTKEIVTNVKIYDFSGNLLLQTTPGTTSPVINMNSFKSGIYFVEITQGNTTEIVRVIK